MKMKYLSLTALLFASLCLPKLSLQAQTDNYHVVVLSFSYDEDQSLNWAADLPKKENGKVFRLIQINIQDYPHTISAYAFPNNYNSGSSSNQAELKKHLIKSVKVSSNSDDDKVKGLVKIVSAVVKEYPADNYGIKFVGHGRRRGLFDGYLPPSSGDFFFESISGTMSTGTMGGLTFLDWGSNCYGASYKQILWQSYNVKYIVASDLLDQAGIVLNADGTQNSKETQSLWNKTNPLYKYSSYWGTDISIEQSLKDMVEDYGEMYDATSAYWQAYQSKQQVSLFNTDALINLQGVLDDIWQYHRESLQFNSKFSYHLDASQQIDVLTLCKAIDDGSLVDVFKKSDDYGNSNYHFEDDCQVAIEIREESIDFTKTFEQLRVSNANNKSTFNWGVPSNGMFVFPYFQNDTQ